jgi:hypothetical protein
MPRNTADERDCLSGYYRRKTEHMYKLPACIPLSGSCGRRTNGETTISILSRTAFSSGVKGARWSSITGYASSLLTAMLSAMADLSLFGTDAMFPDS